MSAYAEQLRAAANYAERILDSVPGLSISIDVPCFASSAPVAVQVTSFDNGTDAERLDRFFALWHELGGDPNVVEIRIMASGTEHLNARDGLAHIYTGPRNEKGEDGNRLSWNALLPAAVSA